MKVNCIDCMYWYSSDDIKKGFGECRVSSPQLREADGRGYWPLTSKLEWCHLGKPKNNQDLITEQCKEILTDPFNKL